MFSGLTIALVLALLSGEGGELSRLRGHDVAVNPDGSYEIRDIAGEGAPRVGMVLARAKKLYLVTESATLELAGPLAQPRIAGPGYKVWVIGKVTGRVLRARRLGILASPPL